LENLKIVASEKAQLRALMFAKAEKIYIHKPLLNCKELIPVEKLLEVLPGCNQTGSLCYSKGLIETYKISWREAARPCEINSQMGKPISKFSLFKPNTHYHKPINIFSLSMLLQCPKHKSYSYLRDITLACLLCTYMAK